MTVNPVLSKPTLVVNAGGASTRMGESKALLPVPPNDIPLIAHIIERLRPLVQPGILVVANDLEVTAALSGDASLRVVTDAWEGVGALAGIATTLTKISGWALVVACDLPLISPALCAHLISLTTERDTATGLEQWDAIVPYVNGYAEPLHALYHRRCIPAVLARIRQQDYRVHAFLDDVRTRRVDEAELRPFDPQLHSFLNANTPREWTTALALLTTASPATNRLS